MARSHARSPARRSREGRVEIYSGAVADNSLRFRIERFTTFVDAVVAIAMTLLILPLMESVSEGAKDGLSTADFLAEHAGQLLSFGLSFLLIATFWMGHHGQYREVEWGTRPLLWINVAWMATIVWLPVPTAMIGQMDTDALQTVVYIGTLTLTQVTTLCGWVYLRRHPDLTTAAPATLRAGVVGDLSAIILFAVALAIALLLPEHTYGGLLVLVLTGPVSRLLSRLASRR